VQRQHQSTKGTGEKQEYQGSELKDGVGHRMTKLERFACMGGCWCLSLLCAIGALVQTPSAQIFAQHLLIAAAILLAAALILGWEFVKPKRF
jgi:hypothetical protein